MPGLHNWIVEDYYIEKLLDIPRILNNGLLVECKKYDIDVNFINIDIPIGGDALELYRFKYLEKMPDFCKKQQINFDISACRLLLYLYSLGNLINNYIRLVKKKDKFINNEYERGKCQLLIKIFKLCKNLVSIRRNHILKRYK